MSADLRREAVDKGPIPVGAEDLRRFSKFLKTAEDGLGAIAQGSQRLDVSHDPFRGDAIHWPIPQGARMTEPKVGQPATVALLRLEV